MRIQVMKFVVLHIDFSVSGGELGMYCMVPTIYSYTTIIVSICVCICNRGSAEMI